MDFPVMKQSLVPEVCSILLVESSEDSSEVEVFICLVTINLVWVDVFREIFKDVEWVCSVRLGIALWD